MSTRNARRHPSPKPSTKATTTTTSTTKPTRTGRLQHRVSMDLPEALRYDDDDEEERSGDSEDAHSPDRATVHQSIFGLISAATQSNAEFQSRFRESASDSEDDVDTKRKDRSAGDFTFTARPGIESASVTQKPIARLSEYRPTLSGRPSGLSSSSSASSTPKPQQHSHSATVPRSGSSRFMASPSVSDSSPPDRDATHSRSPAQSPTEEKEPMFMSQMLQARAKADIESSEATLTRPRSGRETPSSMAASRRTTVALAEAVKGIFKFDTVEDVIAEYKCWFLQSIILEGYMYLTQHHICFYALLPKKSNVTTRSGYLYKRGRHNPRYHRRWFVLKADVLSYYADANDLYFPRDNIDLRYGISADLVPDKDKTKETTAFSVTTHVQTYHFRADTAGSAEEWVKQLQNVIFRSRNDAERVKISIPVDDVLDVEEIAMLGLAETIKLRVVDDDETFALDEYFFSFLGTGDKAMSDLRILTKDTAAQRTLATQGNYRHGTASATRTIQENVRHALSPPRRMAGNTTGAADSEYSPQYFEPSHRQRATGHAQQPDPTPQDSTESFSSLDHNSTDMGSFEGTDASGSHILSGSGVFQEPTIRKRQPSKSGITEGLEKLRERGSSDPFQAYHPQKAQEPTPSRAATEQKHPPKPTTPRRPATVSSKLVDEELGPAEQSDATSALGGLVRAGAIPIQRAAGYLRGHGKSVTSFLGSSPMQYYGKVSGMIAGGKKHYSEADGLSPTDKVRDADDETEDLEAERRFRAYFALPDTERLAAVFFGSLLRGLPFYGKIYIGSTMLCFRSLLVGTNTRLVVPFKDMLTVEKEKGFRLGFSGMVVVIRGHEEIFFEFGQADLRDDCTVTLLRILDNAKAPHDFTLPTPAQLKAYEDAEAEHLLLEEARKECYSRDDDEESLDSQHSVAAPILFDDTSASVLDFCPPEPLRIVCLTIGSRGDVQPYIALCKRLIEEGHKPKIATHAEFKDWVEQYGIEFAPVSGSPAELMRICTEHGMFTPSFIIEAQLKFRGFVTELLATAWDACQDAQVLIESPSAMAGIHIAEALQIPYFRAFTMPWTRTRAYPHAFAVPNHKMGGAYNVLSYTLFDTFFWQFTAGMVNSWRRKSLGLRPTNLERLQQHKVPFMYNFSPSVVVPPLDFSDWIKVTGYWFLDEGKDFQPQKELLDFIKKARSDGVKLVYIGFGSVVVANSKALTHSVVDAVLKADVRCILSKGWSDRLDKKDSTVPEVALPPTIFQIKYPVPHDWLFNQVDAAVHHGGAGTTGASLRAGVPTIIRPFFGDQYFFGNRVQDLGVGMSILKTSEKQLARALWIACNDGRMIEKARVLGEKIRAEDGVGNAVTTIYRDMEYAKSLIKRQGTATRTDEEHKEPDEEIEEWTLVDGDSDPEAISSPKAMMPQDLGSSEGKKKKTGIIQLPSLKKR